MKNDLFSTMLRPLVYHNHGITMKASLTNRPIVRILMHYFRAVSSAGRAREWHSRGQRFDPATVHKKVSGAWLSLARALGSGPRGREFESPRPDMYFTYILRSLKTHRYYTGQCAELENRLKEHNSGESKATRSGIAWELVFYKQFSTRSEAIEEETRIKTRGAARYLESIRKMQPG